MTMSKIVVASFIIQLANRAAYGLKGEKPLALIATLSYLDETKISGVKLLDLLNGDEHSNSVKSIFVELAKKTRKIIEPNISWDVITGSNKELQNSIIEFKDGNVNDAFAKLSSEEIQSLLRSYSKRLDVPL